MDLGKYEIRQVNRRTFDKDGDVISIEAWEVVKKGIVREVFYHKSDAEKYVGLVEKRDADYASLTRLD